MASLGKAFKEGENGCIVSEEEMKGLQNRFVLKMRYEQGQLRVTYGNKMRNSAHKSCIENIFMGNLSYRGYLGVTARNQDRNTKGVEVSIARVMNLDPNFYTSQL